MRVILLITMTTLVALTTSTAQQISTTPCTPDEQRYDVIGNGYDSALRIIYHDESDHYEVRLIGDIGITAKQVYDCLSKAPAGTFYIEPMGEYLRVEPVGNSVKETFFTLKKMLIEQFGKSNRYWAKKVID